MIDNVTKLAIIICKHDGKDPTKNYKGKPIYDKYIPLAKAIIDGGFDLPTVKKMAAMTDNELKEGVREWITVFNSGARLRENQFSSVEKMPKQALELHMDALEAAIEVVNR